jgi:hypothetical protein
MGITRKMQPDKFKKLVNNQNTPQRPPTLGESCEVTNWNLHIEAKHKIKSFAQIRDIPGKQKEAVVHTPGENQYFLAIKENFGDFFYVWILCLTNGSDRINWRINSGEVQFIVWDGPEEVLNPGK